MRARLDDHKSIELVRSALRFGPIAVIFEAQGTRFDMVLHVCGGIADGDDIGLYPARLLVSIINFRSSFHFEFGGLRGIYVSEKLRLTHMADANNVAAFINAIYAEDGTEVYLAGVCNPDYPDQVDHERLGIL